LHSRLWGVWTEDDFFNRDDVVRPIRLAELERGLARHVEVIVCENALAVAASEGERARTNREEGDDGCGEPHRDAGFRRSGRGKWRRFASGSLDYCLAECGLEKSKPTPLLHGNGGLNVGESRVWMS